MGLTIVAYLIMITVAVIITTNEDYDIVAQSRPLLRWRRLSSSPLDPLNKRPQAVFSGRVTQSPLPPGALGGRQMPWINRR